MDVEFRKRKGSEWPFRNNRNRMGIDKYNGEKYLG